MLCQKCGLTEATIHRETVVFRRVVEEHLCLLCAGGLEGGFESIMAQRAASMEKLPWRLTGEWKGEERKIHFDDEGITVLRSLIDGLLDRAGRTVQLSIHFGGLKQFASVILGWQGSSLRLWLLCPDLDRAARARSDKFFLAFSNVSVPEGQDPGAGWKCDLPGEAEGIAAALTKLFTDVFAMTPEVALKVKLAEYFEAGSGGTSELPR